ncbi:MAG: translation elongation factor-like protein, partial [Candidatus Colwellbacteria bacterium]|nr:translation elongation factor-like protein [Candidatus Colwellbacteria bacterium]
KLIGEVTHYYGHLEVAVVKFSKTVKVGEKVHFKGATTDFEQTLDSMQFDHKELKEAKKGKEVGVRVKDKVRAGDEVYEA